jgi:endonuclease/exonuclease/phosphatase family metal-dependent hydrolase
MPGSNGAVRPSLRLLQLNLCNSGIAGCYTGRSVAAAARVIRAERPDVVTLNEVCRADVSVLDRTLSLAYPGGGVVSAFTAAVDRRSGGAVRCRNGQRYGIGVLVRIRPPDSGYRTYRGTYPMQDTADPEERVWLCLQVIDHFAACTTHLASTSVAVAFAQCGELMATAIPAVRSAEPVVIGGDFNLGSGGSRSVRSCLPPGWRHRDDGATQHVLATDGFTVIATRTVSMDGTTDHPGFVVDLDVA